MNDAPSFTKDANQAVLEDAGAQGVAGWATAISAGPADESAQTLTFNVTNNNNDLFSSQPAIASNGTLSYTTAADANGSAIVSVTLSDDGGTANGGVNTSAAQTFTITVTPVNDPPVIDGTIPDQTMPDDGSSWELDLTQYESDVEDSGTALTWSVSGGNPNLFTAVITDEDNDILSFTPADNVYGADIITLTLTDSGGMTVIQDINVNIDNPFTPDDPDSDGDGIPNSEEDFLGTDSEMKTLFVRPMKWDVAEDNWVYWSEFVEVLFPHPDRDHSDLAKQITWMADIPAFTDADIEVVVIGASGNPYSDMSDFNYDPGNPDNNRDDQGDPIDFDLVQDGWQGPHCNIIYIKYYPPESEVYYGWYFDDNSTYNKNYGHIFFTDANNWSWDTKGMTVSKTADKWQDIYYHHDYWIPRIYGYALDNYFHEAPYTELVQNQGPEFFGNWCFCGDDPICWECYDFNLTNGTTPMNLNMTTPSSGPPDDWVEFKPMTFNNNGEIECFCYNEERCQGEDCLEEPAQVTETQFDFNQVLKRTIMHEMGHAVLLGMPDDHCENASCILYSGTKDWTLHPFGTLDQVCTHRDDIMATGTITNQRH